MAPRQVDVTIRGKDETKAGFDAASKNAAGFKGAVTSLLNPLDLLKGAIAGIGLATIGSFLKSSVASAAEAEAAWTRAASALTNAGISANLARPEIEALSASIQKRTRFSDDAATDSFATLVGISKDYANSLKNVSLAADIAAAKKIDLADASKLVGKAMVGETGALARYGIIVDKNADAISQLRERFKGFAEADGATLQGRLHQIANAWDNVLEATGRAVSGMADASGQTMGLADSLNHLSEWIDANSGKVRELGEGLGVIVGWLGRFGGDLLGDVGKWFRGYDQLFELIAAGVRKVRGIADLPEDAGNVEYYKALGRAHAHAPVSALDAEKAKNAADAAAAAAARGPVTAAGVSPLDRARQLGTAHVTTRPAEMASTVWDQQANVGGVPGIVEPEMFEPAVRFTDDLTAGFVNATDAIFGTSDAIHNLGDDISEVAVGAIANFADAWGSATEDIASGSLNVGQAIAKSARVAVAASASAKGSETLLDAGRAFGLGLGGDYKQFAAAAKLFAVGTGYKLLAGVLGGGGGGSSSGGGGGGGGGLSQSGFDQSAKATEHLGTMTVVLNGSRMVIDAADPRSQDDFVAMLKKLGGNRQIDFVVNPSGGA